MTGETECSLIIAGQLLGCDTNELRKSLVSRAMQATKGGRAGTVIQYDYTFIIWSYTGSVCLNSIG